MSREAHVPFCEGLLGKFLRSTLPLFQEDKQKMYNEDGASILAILRRWALNPVKLHPAKTSQNRNSIEPDGVMIILGKRLFLGLVKKCNQPMDGESL